MSMRWMVSPFHEDDCQWWRRNCALGQACLRVRLQCYVNIVAANAVAPNATPAVLENMLHTKPGVASLAMIDTGAPFCKLPAGMLTMVFRGAANLCTIPISGTIGAARNGNVYTAHVLLRPPGGSPRSASSVVLRDVQFHVPWPPTPNMPPDVSQNILIGMSALRRLDMRTYCRERYAVLLQP